MIEYFHILPAAMINSPISKKLIADNGDLSAPEKRILKENVEELTMKALFQTRTIGLDTYSDENYRYDQVVIAEVNINNKTKSEQVASMIQRVIPSPLFLIIKCEEEYSICWASKRINLSDKERRIIESQENTRFFKITHQDEIAFQWLKSLDISKIVCNNLKEFFEQVSKNLLMLKVSDEAGMYISASLQDANEYRTILNAISDSRNKQKDIIIQIKAETQFNTQLKLNTQLKELQIEEKILKEKIRKE
jgi:hypothetical protein